MGRVQAAALLLAGLASVARAQSPRIDSIEPTQGPIAGGTVVTVSGVGFSGASVTLDQKPIAPTSISDTQIRLVMPQHDNGYALIQVTASGPSSAAEFLYVPPKLEDLPPGYITTVAGVGKYVRVELPATQAMIDPEDVTVAANGDIYFMEVRRSLLFRVDSQGILHHVAGTLGPQDSEFVGDGGPALDAAFGFSRSVAVDAAGNAYITDSRGRIRKVDAASGIVTTVAGTGQLGFSGDGGPATLAQIGEPTHIACAPDGTLYFLDSAPVGGGTPKNLRVRKVTPDGVITTIAGNGTVGDNGDGGPAVNASLNIGLDDLGDVAIDSKRNVFILEYDGLRIRRVDAQTGVITMFASLAFPAGDPRSSAETPAAIAIDGADNVYAATHWNFFKFDPSSRLLDTWGSDTGFSEDGTPARQMRVDHLRGVAIAPNGDIVFSDESIRRVRKIDAVTQTLKTVAGIAPNAIGVPGDARGAVLASPQGDLAFLPSGDLLYADTSERRIYRIDVHSGAISAFAGTGTTAYGSYIEAPALQSDETVNGMDVDAQGNVYMTDYQTVRSIDPQGIVHLIAGSNQGNYGFSGDGGPAKEALLCQPSDVALDRDGNLFIVDTNNNRIRRIDHETGIITTVAGSGPVNGVEGYGHGTYCGDGGPALEACLNTPMAVAVDPNGNLFINDYANQRLRKVDGQGTIRTFSDFSLLGRIYADPYGGLFVRAQRAQAGLWRFLADGSHWLLAGSSADSGFSGDGGPATAARLGVSDATASIAVDAAGNLFFHDEQNYRIRAVRFGAVLAPPNAQVSATLGDGQSAPAATAYASPLEVTVKTEGGIPAPGVRVDFVAPSKGPHGVFSNGRHTISVLTDRSGKAQATCAASCQAGAYTVTATALGSTAQLRFALTNTSSRRRCTTVIAPR